MSVGVYICHCGGNISEVINTKELVSLAEEEPDVVVARDYEYMCSQGGQKLILDDIKDYKLDRIVIASCSPQFHESTFRKVLENAGLNPYLLEIANIREQCSWVYYDEPEAATEKAKDILRMAIAKVRFDEPLEVKSVPMGNRVLVIGGGISGIQAALDLGDMGFKVYLVEKEPTIGGRMAQLSRTFPTEDCSACILAPKMSDVASHPNITLFTYSEIEDTKGCIGNFEVTVKKKPRYVNAEKCTGCGICEQKCPVKATNEFDFGLTLRKAIYVPCEFTVPSTRLIDSNICLYFTKNVCRICERFCPANAIEFDQEPEEINIKVDTIIVATGYKPFDAKEKRMYGYGVYKNVITGPEMERIVVYSAKGKPLRDVGKRIAFIQCVGSRDEQIDRMNCSRVCCMYAVKLAQILKRTKPERDVYVFYTDIRAYGKGFEEYYRRALQAGVKFIRGRVGDVIEDPKTGKLNLRYEDTLIGQVLERAFDMVILSTGLVPSDGTNKIAEILNLARSPDGFLQEAHPKFRPVDTLIEGVFICGCAQGPKDIPDSVAQASAAASRAVRLMNKKEYVVEPIKAFVNEELCDGCGFCVEQCPLKAITVSKVAEVNEVLCNGCGGCIEYCPKGALDLRHYKNIQLLAEIKAALESKRDGETRMLAFLDEMCGFKLADSVGTSRMPYTNKVDIVRVPCVSRITSKLMLEAFKLGADGIFIGGCEAKSSPYPNSAEIINKNISNVKKTLEEKGIEPERVRYSEFVTVMLGGFVKQLNEFSVFLEKSGPISTEKILHVMVYT